MNQKLSTRALTEGALMAGLAVIFVMLGMLPIVGALTVWISSIPITVVTARHGSFSGGLSAILATILITLLLGPLSGLNYGLGNMLLGFVIGALLNKRKSGIKILQASALTAALAALVLMIVSLGIMGFTPDTISTYYAEMETEMLELYESSGLIDAMTAQEGISSIELTAMLQSMVSVMVKLSPSMMFLMGVLNGAVTYWLTMLVLKRLKVRIPRSTGLANWRLPFSAIWGIIVVWALWLMGDRIPFDWINIVILNCIVVCAALLLLNGLTAAMHMLDFKHMSTGMKVLMIMTALLFFTGVLVGLILLGIADLLFDFRKKKVDNNR